VGGLIEGVWQKVGWVEPRHAGPTALFTAQHSMLQETQHAWHSRGEVGYRASRVEQVQGRAGLAGMQGGGGLSLPALLAIHMYCVSPKGCALHRPKGWGHWSPRGAQDEVHPLWAVWA